MKLSPAAMADRASDAEHFLKQLTNRKRLMMPSMLIDGERQVSVRELNELIPVLQSALFRHLRACVKRGLSARDARRRRFVASWRIRG